MSKGNEGGRGNGAKAMGEDKISSEIDAIFAPAAA